MCLIFLAVIRKAKIRRFVYSDLLFLCCQDTAVAGGAGPPHPPARGGRHGPGQAQQGGTEARGPTGTTQTESRAGTVSIVDTVVRSYMQKMTVWSLWVGLPG